MRIKPMINLYDKQQFSPWDWSFKDTEMTQISTNITNVHQLDLGCPDVAKSNKTVTSGRVKQPVQLGTVVPLLLVPPHRPWSCAASVGPPWNDKRTWSGWIRVCTITISYLYSSLSTYQFELRKCQLLIAGAWKVLKVAQTRQHGQPPSMRTQEKCGHFSSSMTLSCVGGYREGRVVCYWTGLSACHHPQNHSTVFESLHIIYLAQLHHEDPESIPASDSLQLWISRSCLEGTSKRCQVHVLSIRFPSYRPKNAKLFLLIFCSHPSSNFPSTSPHFSIRISVTQLYGFLGVPGTPSEAQLAALGRWKRHCRQLRQGCWGWKRGRGVRPSNFLRRTGSSVSSTVRQWDLGIYMNITCKSYSIGDYNWFFMTIWVSIIMNHLFV